MLYASSLVFTVGPLFTFGDDGVHESNRPREQRGQGSFRDGGRRLSQRYNVSIRIKLSRL